MKTLVVAPSKSDIYDVIKKEVNKTMGSTNVNWFFYDLNEHDVDVDDLIHQCISLSMFDIPRIILIYYNANHKRTKDIAEALNYMDDSIHCFVGVEGKKISNQDPIISEINKEKRRIEIQALTPRVKQELIFALIKQHQVKLDHTQIDYLNHVLSNDRHQIESEINKLSLYPNEISMSTLKALICPQMSDSVFELSKAIMKKDLNQSFGLYQDLMLLKVDPVAIIPILAWQLRLMLQIFELRAHGMPVSSMNQVLNENPYSFDKALEYTRFTSHQSVRQLLIMLSQLDVNIKQGKQDKKIGFERFLLESVR